MEDEWLCDIARFARTVSDRAHMRSPDAAPGSGFAALVLAIAVWRAACKRDFARPRSKVVTALAFLQEIPMDCSLGRSVWTLTILAMAGWANACPASLLADEKEGKEQPVSYWMKKKLDYSQNILAGIATADFDKIVENAQSMRNLNKIEGFIRGRAPGYRNQLQIFEVSLDEIIRQAQKDNVDGAALGFTQLTISCVNCHKQIREAK